MANGNDVVDLFSRVLTIDSALDKNTKGLFVSLFVSL